MHEFMQENKGKQGKRAQFGLKIVHYRKKWLKIGHACGRAIDIGFLYCHFMRSFSA